MITAKWYVVHRKLPQNAIAPWCAFSDARDAEGMLLLPPGERETIAYVILERTVNVGGTDAMQLLADIVSNDYSQAGDQKMMRAIAAARKLLGIPTSERSLETYAAGIIARPTTTAQCARPARAGAQPPHR